MPFATGLSFICRLSRAPSGDSASKHPAPSLSKQQWNLVSISSMRAKYLLLQLMAAGRSSQIGSNLERHPSRRNLAARIAPLTRWQLAIAAPVERQVQDAQAGQTVQRRQLCNLIVLHVQRLQMWQPRGRRQQPQPAPNKSPSLQS